MGMLQLYKRFKKGERFKGINEIDLRKLPIKQPADLVGPSLIMQEMAKKHAKTLKN
ncbi:hypothetical protein H1Z61_05230 [Bacillus aquiflavi]|uniref:Uncharacterized protein n=2 Tax=Bacillus aquiflavi TaxID=2672567 RepID=A0A6B3W020_9BACI|nr:hypothetical protein [Bacillus aquiflavi]MBA4536567.1 hypothetical protein [Bacillus aquiflavi]NEY80934.1 hypothetical protein [Bacillus aquiflavi]